MQLNSPLTPYFPISLIERLRASSVAPSVQLTQYLKRLETENEAIERAVQRTIEHRDAVTLNLIRAVYRFRDGALLTKRKTIVRLVQRRFAHPTF
jgi:hypothetical protein